MWMPPPTHHNLLDSAPLSPPGLAQNGGGGIGRGVSEAGGCGLIEGYGSFPHERSAQCGHYGSILEQLHAIGGGTGEVTGADGASDGGDADMADMLMMGDEEVEFHSHEMGQHMMGSEDMHRPQGQEQGSLDSAAAASDAEEDHNDYWGGNNARISKSSQLVTRAHSRSPAPSINLADNHEEVRRAAEGPWRCLVEEGPVASPPTAAAPPPPPPPAGASNGPLTQLQSHPISAQPLPHPLPPPGSFPPNPLAPTSLKQALSGNPHNNQHRTPGQYKRLISQSKRGLKSSISLDSLRSAFPHQSLYNLLPSRRLSSTKSASILSPTSEASTPTTTAAAAALTATKTTPSPSSSFTAASISSSSSRDQLTSPTPVARQSCGVDKKSIQSSLLRRRPSAQLLSSTSLLDRLKLEDSMMSTTHQHIQPSHMGSMEDMSAHGQQHIMNKYNTDMSSYGAPVPLSPPPSATRPDFIASTNSYHVPVSEDDGLSFNGNEMGMARPHSMSSLRAGNSYSETNHSEDGVRRLSDPYQSLESVAESSMYIRQAQHGCWTPQNWMSDIPSSLDMGMMDQTPSQSPTTQQWADEQSEAENRVQMQMRMGAENGMPVMVGNMNHPMNSFRLALPPSGRNVQRMPSCPNFRATSTTGYHLQQPPSPALEEHDLANFQGFVARSRSTSSSIPSPPESPDFYYPACGHHRGSSAGYPSTPLPGQESFPSDVYSQMSDGNNSLPRGSNPHHQPPRIPPRGVSSTAAAAAAAALAAAKSSSKRSKSRNNRRTSNQTNGRNQSRSGSIAQPMSNGGRGGLGMGGEGSEMSFVNFTPQDANRILSGVAPSGSSKTKARREREAMEKRRKLSEAAAAAVLAAGGDASQLPGLLTI